MKKSLYLITLFLIFFSNNLFSNTATVNFTSPIPSAPSVCNDTWSEDGIPLQIVPNTGSCYFDYGTINSGDLWLFPARLTADLSGLGNITSIEIDITDFCAIGCTSGQILNGTTTVANISNSISNTQETIVFNNTNNVNIDGLFIESFEGVIHEIRINYGVAQPPMIDCHVVVPFDVATPNPPVNCFDDWSESYIPQQVVPIPPSTTCSSDFSNGVFWLFPARLEMDLSSFSNITSIEIDITDFCSVGCTTAEILASGNSVGSFSNSSTGAETFIFMNVGQDMVDQIYIQSFEASVSEVRIYMEMNECAGELTINGGTLNQGIYSGCEKLHSTSEVDGDVDFVSQVDICLLPGFHGIEGSDFIAYLDPNYCSPQTFAFNPSEEFFEEKNISNQFRILENPSKENLTVILNLEKESKIYLTLHDANGQLIEIFLQGQQMEIGTQQIQFKINAFPSGIYFVTLWENGKPTTKKFSLLN